MKLLNDFLSMHLSVSDTGKNSIDKSISGSVFRYLTLIELNTLCIQEAICSPSFGSVAITNEASLGITLYAFIDSKDTRLNFSFFIPDSMSRITIIALAPLLYISCPEWPPVTPKPLL